MVLLEDFRHAFRYLRSAPAFSAAAVLTLGLGIGASTTVFSAIDAVLVRPGELADLVRITPPDAERGRQATLDEFESWRAALHDIAVAGYALKPVHVRLHGERAGAAGAERVLAAAVAGPYFEAVRARAALGRTFTDNEPNVVVLSNHLWRQLFDGRPDAIGGTVAVDGVPHTIIGVLREEHRFPRSDVGIWTPLTRRTVEAVTVIARVNAGAPLDPVRARVQSIHGARAGDAGGTVRVERVHESLLNDRLRAAAMLGSVTVLLVLLIACANAAGLILARNIARRSELATRAALGASRGRLTRQLLVESGVLACLGGLLGIAVAAAGTRWLMHLWQAVPDVRPFPTNVEFGSGLLLWALAATVAAALLAGFAPGWHGSRTAPQAVLSEFGRAATTPRRGLRLDQIFVVVQIALAFTLVTASALLARSFTALQDADLGFTVEDVLTFRVSPASSGSTAAELDAWLDERLRSLPTVQAVGRAAELPLDAVVPRTAYEVRLSPRLPGGSWTAAIRRVDDGYHAALEIPILEGRGLDPRTVDGIVISQRLAQRHWPEGGATGQVLHVGGRPRPILGVAGDTREWGPHADAPALIYERTAGGGIWIVRRAPGAPPILPTVRALVGRFDADAAVHDASTMQERLRQNTARSELLTRTMAMFAALALLLAAGGVHASTAHATARRTRELAIRRALGAPSGAIVRLVLGQGGSAAAGGMLAGAAIALALGRLLQRFLPNVGAQDPTAFLAAAAVLAGAILLACSGSARRAVLAEPLDALRHE